MPHDSAGLGSHHETGTVGYSDVRIQMGKLLTVNNQGCQAMLQDGKAHSGSITG